MGLARWTFLYLIIVMKYMRSCIQNSYAMKKKD